MTDPSARRRWPLLACIAIYLGLALANGLVWENAHDEGVTFHQAIGHNWLTHDASQPVPVSEAYRWIDGSRAHAPHDVVAALVDPDARGMHPPAYYLFVNQWGRRVGTGTLRLRLPAYLAGVLSLIAIGLLAQRLVPRPEAALAAPLLLALSPWFVSFSNYARPYAIALCIALWSTHWMLELVSAPATTRRRAGFAALSLLGLYTIYHYAFVLAWQAAILGVSALRRGPGRRGPAVAALVAMGSAVVAGYLPWIPHLLAHLRVVQAPDLYFHGAIPPGRWLATAGSTLRTFALAEVGSESRALTLGLAALGILTLPFVLARFRPATQAALPPPARLVWYLMPLLPLLLVVADLVNDSKTIAYTKTSFPLLPLLILGVVGGICGAPSRGARSAGLAAWVLLFAIGSAVNLDRRIEQRTDFERVAAELAKADDGSHVVVLSSNLPGYAIPLLLSFRDAGIHNLRLLQAPGPELGAAVRTLRQRADVRRVTLIRFEIPYARGLVASGNPFLKESQGWSGAQLRAVAHEAQAAGWKVGELDSAAPTPADSSRRRMLAIAPGVRVKYFSM